VNEAKEQSSPSQLSGVARVPCALRQKIFLRPLQQNFQNLN